MHLDLDRIYAIWNALDEQALAAQQPNIVHDLLRQNRAMMLVYVDLCRQQQEAQAVSASAAVKHAQEVRAS